jgi:hypothetical protein
MLVALHVLLNAAWTVVARIAPLDLNWPFRTPSRAVNAFVPSERIVEWHFETFMSRLMMSLLPILGMNSASFSILFAGMVNQI